MHCSTYVLHVRTYRYLFSTNVPLLVQHVCTAFCCRPCSPLSGFEWRMFCRSWVYRIYYNKYSRWRLIMVCSIAAPSRAEEFFFLGRCSSVSRKCAVQEYIILHVTGCLSTHSSPETLNLVGDLRWEKEGSSWIMNRPAVSGEEKT